MRKLLPNLGCFILFILFLPLIIIVAGPLLVLAALRGRQPAGPITLDTVRYGPTGRVGAFLLGLAIWLLIWGSLAWLAIANGLSAPTMAALSSNLLPAETPVAPVATSTPLPPTPTSLLLTPSLTETPTPIPAPISGPTDTATPAATATPTATPTELVNEVPATDTPTASPTTPSTSTPTPPETIEAVDTATPAPPPVEPPPDLSAAEQETILATVKDGNSLLRKAVAEASEENLQNLTARWQGDALPVARNFAINLYESYAKPFEVEFEYLTFPFINSDRNQRGEIVVISRERWSYNGPTTTQEETFEFIYSLSQIDGRWMITDYIYRNLRLPTRTRTPAEASPTQTSTPTSTSPEQ